MAESFFGESCSFNFQSHLQLDRRLTQAVILQSAKHSLELRSPGPEYPEIKPNIGVLSSGKSDDSDADGGEDFYGWLSFVDRVSASSTEK